MLKSGLFHNRDEVISAMECQVKWTEKYIFNNWGHGYYEYKNNGDITNISGVF